MGNDTENAALLPTFSRRAASGDDTAFLLRVYADSRADELMLVPWSDAQKEAFLQQQFSAQDFHYRKYYPEAAFEMVLVDDVPVGRLYTARAEFTDEIRLMDIALLSAFRGRGIGTRLIRETMTEAASMGRGVRLHVEFNNPARRLYDRLGFRFVKEEGPYLMLEWLPPAETG